jgi:hypothetical protein
MTVTFEHEGLALLFRNRPSLSAEVLAQIFGQSLPVFAASKNESTDLTRVVPDQFFADVASLHYGPDGKPVFGTITEVQRKLDPDKRKTWPVYVAVQRAQHDCPVWLLVVAPDPAVARWAAEPIDLGHPGFVLEPLVLGAALTPVVTQVERARSAPELAVLSAMMHGRGKRGAEVALAALEGIKANYLGRDDKRLRVYQDLIDSSLSELARQALEAIMASGDYEYQGPFAKRYVAEGKAEGLAEGKAEGKAEGLRMGIVAICKGFGIALTPTRRARLEAMGVAELEALCRALPQQGRWPAAAGTSAPARPRTTAPKARAKKR